MQFSTFQGNSSFQKRLGVLGLSTLDSVNINGPLKMLGVGDVPTQSQVLEMIMRDPLTGMIFKASDGVLKEFVYRPLAEAELPCRDDAGGNIMPANPIWNNAPGILYTNTQCVPDVKVGIGLSAPTAKLHIQTRIDKTTHPILVTKGDALQTKIMQLDNTGLLYAREIKVNLDAWPDYVFESNYPLLPLDKLASYIDQNKHLPGVPSACEMEENGVNVAETSTMLMEKVEELTLYLLQLQNQLDTQKQLILEQQAAIARLQATPKN